MLDTVLLSGKRFGVEWHADVKHSDAVIQTMFCTHAISKTKGILDPDNPLNPEKFDLKITIIIIKHFAIPVL